MWSREWTLGNTISTHYMRGSSNSGLNPNYLEETLYPPPLQGGTQDNYMPWTGHCLECSAIRKQGHGLFCRNFLLAWGNYPPCRSVWCGGCYRESPDDNFPRMDQLQSGSDLNLKVDAAYIQNRNQCGRDGDHLMGVPFERDLCSF